MCDSLCARRPDGTVFGKNSDRPPSEIQLIEFHEDRAPGGSLRTQYLTIDDDGAAALIGARPDWLWGMEHGVNRHGVAIGNERVFTIDDPAEAPPGLIGMDLVRLALERAESATAAVEVIGGLIETHGQGGAADPVTGDAYFSSFLIADPHSAWTVESSGRDWVALPVDDHAALSNRLTLHTCDRGSVADPDRFDPQSWLPPDEWTAHADHRLASSRAALAGSSAFDARSMAAALRDHGGERWGRPGTVAPPTPPPDDQGPNGEGWTVCMHVRGLSTTTSSLIAWLDGDGGHRAWVAQGSPCVSVFVPVSPAGGAPNGLADPARWWQLARLRDLVDSEPGLITTIRADLDPIETSLWDEADTLASGSARPADWERFARKAQDRVTEAVDRLIAGLWAE